MFKFIWLFIKTLFLLPFLPIVIVVQCFIKRLDDKHMNSLKSNIIILAIFCAYMCISGADDAAELEALIPLLLMFGGGAVIGLIGYFVKKKKRETYQTYIDYIHGVDTFNVQAFGDHFGLSLVRAKLTLYDMIDGRLIQGSISDNVFIFGTPKQALKKEKTKNIKVIEVQCRNCGAVNKISVGSSTVCEYCDSDLK